MISVAIVDDDSSVRKGLSRLLRSAGFSAAAFASAEDFLASAEGLAAGCLVLDIQLGGMNGFELLEKLRQTGHAPETLFITAQDEDVTRDALRAAGSPECLWKPFEGNAVLDWVRRALGETRGQTE